MLGVDDHTNQPGAAVARAAERLRAHGVARVTNDVVSALPHPAELDVRSVVLTSITDLAPDLVAVGARGTGGSRGLLVGSVAAAVVNHAACSVLVVKTS